MEPSGGPYDERRGEAAHRVEHFLAHREDIVGVGEDTLPQVGEDEPASGAREQRPPDFTLEIRDLLADRGLGQAQRLARRSDAPALRGRPEAAQVIEVQTIHGPIIHRLCLYFKIWAQ